MKYQTLGRTGIEISRITLGTMTWGQQNTEAEAHAQIDLALEAGVNIIDAAEMYPVPPRPETQGRTESYIGSWFARTGKRDQWFLATKAAGPVRMKHQPAHLRDGKTHFDRRNLTLALEDSLRRLRTDHVDLYQLHWPDRSTNTFGQLGYRRVEDEFTVPIAETLEILGDLVKQGKIRFVGVSNETPWGLSQFLNLAEQTGLPRIVSIQNAYNLLNRTFEIGLAEFSHREQVELLAYSPLAFGVLSGKYLDGRKPQGARLTEFDRFVRYNHPLAEKATAEYVTLARTHGLDPAQLAIAFTLHQPFVASSIIGATNLEQLRADIEAVDLVLSPDVIAGIEAIHAAQPNPVH